MLFWITIIICHEAKMPISISLVFYIFAIIQRFIWLKEIKKEFSSYTKKAILLAKII